MTNIEISKVNFAVLDSLHELDLSKEMFDKSDIVLCGYSLLQDVDFDSEFSAGVGQLWEVSRKLTKYAKPTFCAAMTHYSGYFHMSVITFVSGGLIDIADRTQNLRDDSCNNSNKIKVYNTIKNRVALLIDTDILLPSNWKKIAGLSSIVLGIAQDFTDEQASKVYALSKRYKIPFLLKSTNGIWWSDI